MVDPVREKASWIRQFKPFSFSGCSAVLKSVETCALFAQPLPHALAFCHAARSMRTLSGISKAYGGRVLFADVTLQVNRQDRLGLVGPNAAGKTTLFSLILGAVATRRDRKFWML